MQEEIRINEKKENPYKIHSNTIEEVIRKKYYEKSMGALVQYMKDNEENPSEKRWNRYAISQKCLSSKTIGYLSGIGFNTLCRKLRKELNKEKRQTHD